MNIALEVAKRSTCNRANVGCVLVRDNRLLSSGYNGSPSGLPHCTDVGCDMEHNHCVRTVHAEINAVIQAARHGVSTQGATAYVTHHPCNHCAMSLINAGVDKVCYNREYFNHRAYIKLLHGGVHVWHSGRVENAAL